MPLPILRLPQNVQINAIEQMKPIQQLGFSTLSNRTKNIVASSNLELKNVQLYFGQKCVMYLFFGSWGSMKSVEIEFRRNYQNEIVRVAAHAAFNDDDTREYDFFRKWGSNFRGYLEHILFVISCSKQINEVIFSSNAISVNSVFLNLKKINIKKIQISPFCTRQVSRQILNRCLAVDCFNLTRNPYETVTGTHRFLMRNLNDVRLNGHNNVFNFTLNDLLISNYKNIVITWSTWTAKIVNRFLKLWVKGSNSNLKSVDIWISSEHLINEDIVLKGIVTHEVGKLRYFYNPQQDRYGVKRKDGTLAVLSIQSTNINVHIIRLDVDPQQ